MVKTREMEKVMSKRPLSIIRCAKSGWPVTGQIDFAHLMIDYAPGPWLLESKSLKLYVASFRNHGAFHEDCTVMIGKRIASEIKPKFLRIGGYWYPRGGIPIDVFWQTGKLPKGLWLPDQGVAPYRGRG